MDADERYIFDNRAASYLLARQHVRTAVSALESLGHPDERPACLLESIELLLLAVYGNGTQRGLGLLNLNGEQKWTKPEL
jgi:hypothetical protein